MSSQRPIIIKKKKGGHHGGHHGGAWKVAYADFVTAMMAFFLVMWIMGLSDSVKRGISGYFREPGVFSFTTGKALPIEVETAPSIRSGDGSGETSGKKKGGAQARLQATRIEMQKLAREFKKQLEDLAKGDSRLAKLSDAVTFEVTAEGMRIELAESRDIAFFNLGGSQANPVTQQVLAALAPELKRLGAPLDIEGHTDRRPYDSTNGYSNWELSADRANSARKILTSNGLPDAQIRAVTGFADRKPRRPEDPYDVANRRVSLIVRYFPRDSQTIELDSGVEGKLGMETGGEAGAERGVVARDPETLEGVGPKERAPARAEPERAASHAAAEEPKHAPVERTAPEHASSREKVDAQHAEAERPKTEGERAKSEARVRERPEPRAPIERGVNLIGPVISPSELEGAYRRSVSESRPH